MKPRIAILGAGSLGTILGAYLTRAGREVDLIDTYREHVEALNRFGAVVTGTDEFTVPVHAIHPDDMSGTYDYVFYLAKQTADPIALPRILPRLHENSVFCTMQNGLPEEQVAAYVGHERVLGAPVGWGATFLRPGVSCLTSERSTVHFTLGRPGRAVDETVLEVRSLLEDMCRTEVTDNLLGVRWCKLAMNAAFSGLSTALGCTFGDILDDEPSLAFAAGIGKECADVSHALGIRMDPIGGNDFQGALYYRTDAELRVVMDRYRILWAGQRRLKASMLQDLEKGRPCEIDSINGMVVQNAGRCGISAPKNQRLVDVIHRIERKQLSPGRENLSLLTL